MKTSTATCLALLCLALATALPARTDPGPDTVPYVSGGVGKGERSRLMQIADDYNLKLVFFTDKRHSFLAQVDVEIRGEDGRAVLKAVSSGPWFFVRLPAGSYQLSARARGLTLNRKVTLPAGGRQQQVNFAWPDAGD